MITNILIPSSGYELSSGDELSDLSKINIFVGSNNSGKSRFLRSLLNKNQYELSDFNLEDYNNVVESLNREKLNLPTPSVFHSFQGKKYEKIKEGENILTPLVTLKGQMSNPSVYNSMTTSGYGSGGGNNEMIGRAKLAVIERELSNIDMDYEFPDFQKVYIPMLRGLRGFDKYIENSENLYERRTKNDYFSGLEEVTIDGDKENVLDFDIFTGLSLYDDIKKMLLGSHEKRELVREYELFLKDNFFGGLDISLTPNIKDDVLHIKIGDDEKEIYNLGDGIQTIIIMTFPLFKYKDENLLLYIEEPEMTLHPGMQRKLLDIYASNNFPNLQVFLTTHSNHFLDISLDYFNQISTYSFSKIGSNFLIDNKNENKNVLNLLGVRNSSVFLSNCIIWVEGISDRIYIKKFLELYIRTLNTGDKIFEEDRHYSILEYGGGNVTHFNFDKPDHYYGTINVESINKDNFIVCDHDGVDFSGQLRESDPEKVKRLKILKKTFGDNHFFGKHREIENLLGTDIYVKYFDNEDFSSKKIKKDYRNHSAIDWSLQVGTIMKNHFISKKSSRDLSYFDKKNHIECIGKSKTDIAFSMMGILDETEFNNLTSDAQELTKKIYKFIKNNNT